MSAMSQIYFECTETDFIVTVYTPKIYTGSVKLSELTPEQRAMAPHLERHSLAQQAGPGLSHLRWNCMTRELLRWQLSNVAGIRCRITFPDGRTVPEGPPVTDGVRIIGNATMDWAMVVPLAPAPEGHPTLAEREAGAAERLKTVCIRDHQAILSDGCRWCQEQLPRPVRRGSPTPPAMTETLAVNPYFKDCFGPNMIYQKYIESFGKKK
jgi:hypothetical protein